MRFAMARATTVGWLLRCFGAHPGNSYLAVHAGEVEARFGPLFHERFLVGELESAALHARALRWWQTGLGWRANFVGGIGLISASRNLVKLSLKAPRRQWLVGVPMRLKDLFVSLEEPDRFLAALRAQGVRIEPAA